MLQSTSERLLVTTMLGVCDTVMHVSGHSASLSRFCCHLPLMTHWPPTQDGLTEWAQHQQATSTASCSSSWEDPSAEDTAGDGCKCECPGREEVREPGISERGSE